MGLGRNARQQIALTDGATITGTPNARETVFTVTVAGDRTIDLVGTSSEEGDIVIFDILSDSTIRTLTLGLLQKNAAATIVTVASEKVNLRYRFDGTNFIESSRTIAAS